MYHLFSVGMTKQARYRDYPNVTYIPRYLSNFVSINRNEEMCPTSLSFLIFFDIHLFDIISNFQNKFSVIDYSGKFRETYRNGKDVLIPLAVPDQGEGRYVGFIFDIFLKKRDYFFKRIGLHSRSLPTSLA